MRPTLSGYEFVPEFIALELGENKCVVGGFEWGN